MLLMLLVTLYVEDKTKEIKAWEDTDNKALSVMCLKMESHITIRFTSLSITKQLWDGLEKNYLTPTPTFAFNKFKMLMDVVKQP